MELGTNQSERLLGNIIDITTITKKNAKNGDIHMCR